jgi:sugar phosphate isomerase/epimerase
MVPGLRLCLSLDHTPTDDLDEQIQAAGRAGFACVELWAPALDAYLRRRPLIWLDALLVRHRVHSCVLNGPALPALGQGEDSAYSQANFMELCTHLDALGGGTIVLQPAKLEGQDRDRSEESVRALRAYADLAAPFEVTLAFQFKAGSTVPDLRTAQQIADRADKHNLRLAISTSAWYESRTEPQRLEALEPGQLALVHLDSPLPTAQPSPTSEEAALTLALCRKLAASGFRGLYSLPLGAQPGTLVERAGVARQAALGFLQALNVEE